MTPLENKSEFVEQLERFNDVTNLNIDSESVSGDYRVPNDTEDDEDIAMYSESYFDHLRLERTKSSNARSTRTNKEKQLAKRKRKLAKKSKKKNRK